MHIHTYYVYKYKLLTSLFFLQFRSKRKWITELSEESKLVEILQIIQPPEREIPDVVQFVRDSTVWKRPG